MTVAASLEDARARTLDVLAPLDDAVLVRQHSPLMSPLVWDLGHVANYEEQWLVRALGGDPVRPELDDLYDAFRHPRRERHALAIPGPAEARAYAASVRSRALDVLAGLPEPSFFHQMVTQHEHQHIETMLAAIQLLPAPGLHPTGGAAGRGAAAQSVARPVLPPVLSPVLPPLPPPAPPPVPPPVLPPVLLPGGTFVMGTSSDETALDNEKPAHEVTVAPFRLDATPVTNGSYAAFVADGGYDTLSLWTPEGWKWRLEADLSRPQTWSRDGSRDRFGWEEELPADEPVQHVCWYEADAFCRWAGARLPTETEWEFAASNGGTTRWPWGSEAPSATEAALWSAPSSFGPGPAGAHPAGANNWGVQDLVGGVWEWTSSDFRAHPGFTAWPYKEYSEVFFGPDYKVLRGGSWATHPYAMRATFRNWDYPIRRQIFSGFRCARHA